MTGIDDLAAHGADQLEVEAVLGAVGVHRVEQDLPGAELGRPRRPRDRVEPGRLAGRRGWSPRSRSRCPAARRASTDSTSTWLPNRSAISATSSGRWIAAVLTATLSAPARSSRSTSSTRTTPPPTVSGMKTSSAVRETISIVVARPSWEAEMSRKVSSSAPSASYSLGQLDRVAGVAELLEVDALDHPAGVDVEARDDADGEAHVGAAAVSASASSRVNRPS